MSILSFPKPADEYNKSILKAEKIRIANIISKDPLFKNRTKSIEFTSMVDSISEVNTENFFRRNLLIEKLHRSPGIIMEQREVKNFIEFMTDMPLVLLDQFTGGILNIEKLHETLATIKLTNTKINPPRGSKCRLK